MTDALLFTASDLMPLRTDLEAMDGALAAVEAAVLAYHEGQIRQYNVQDRRPGEFEGIRVSLSAGDGLYTGMRVFGNPPHTRAFQLFDGETRQMLCLMDYGVLNSLRVGAIAGVAARHLAPKDATVVGLIGSGWQAGPQAVALLKAAPSIQQIRVHSPTPAHREAFAATMTGSLGIEVSAVASVAEAIQGADIVDLCAPGHHDVREPLFDAAWVKPGALVVSMAGAQCTPAFVRGARVVATNWRVMAEETTPKAPYDELIASGAFGPNDLTEFGPVVAGNAEPRRNPSDRVLYELTGGNFHDLFVATWGYEWARARGLGHAFDLSA